jgi:iron complex transport system substrate-binding protein
MGLVACRTSPAGKRADVARALVAIDADGDTVRLNQPAQRVVSLVPSATEMVIALGATSQLVGRTRYDRDPALASVPSVGGGIDPNLEQLTALRPDLVLLWEGKHGSAVRAGIDARGITSYATPIRDTAAVFSTTAALGHLLGRDSAAAALADHAHTQLAAVRQSVAGRPTPTVLFAIWGDPPMTVGPRTFIAELIRVAGGRNAFDDAATDWPQVSMEEIVARAPGVILLSVGEDRHGGAERLMTTPGWRDLPAVRAGRVIEVPADLTNRPGPAIGDVAQLFRDAIHPEAKGSAPATPAGVHADVPR